MGDAARLIGLNLVFVGVGLALVRVFGVRLGPGWLPTALGLAPATGMLVCALVAAELAALGIGVGILTVAVATTAAIAAVALLTRRVQPSVGSLRPQPQSRLGIAAELGSLCLLALVSVNALRLVAVMPLSSWDGWAIWGARSHTLYESGDAWTTPFQEPAYATQHLDYPLLYPSLEALALHAIGRFDVSLIDVQPMLLLTACALAVWALLRVAVPPWLAAMSAVGLLGSGTLVQNVSWNYADGAVAAVSALGLVCLGLWLVHASSTALCFAALFLSSSALLKNEGLMFAAAGLVAAIGASLVSGRQVRKVLLVAATVVAASAPWQAFIAINALAESRDYDLTSLADPGYLIDNASRFELVSRTLASQLLEVWTLPTVAGALALFGALLARRFALFVLATGWAVIGFAGLVATYVASTQDLTWHLQTSADRVVATLATGAFLLSPLVVWELWGETRPQLERLRRTRLVRSTEDAPARRPSASS